MYTKDQMDLKVAKLYKTNYHLFFAEIESCLSRYSEEVDRWQQFSRSYLPYSSKELLQKT